MSALIEYQDTANAPSALLDQPLIVDNFAGAGGASLGMANALGRSVDIAINHDTDAIAMHEANHPGTFHYCESVWDICPRKATQGRHVAAAWFSPDCRHFSKCKNGKPKKKEIRGLAWVAVRWAATVRPDVIFLENVEEFKSWGPLLEDGMPCKQRAGQTFQSFVNALKKHGYRVETKELIAADFGAATKRKRLFLVARCDGKAIVWPTPTHAPYQSAQVERVNKLPYEASFRHIDWQAPTTSILGRPRPIVLNTLKRIVRGIKRFVIEERAPFVVQRGYGERPGQVPRAQDAREPFGTFVAGGIKHCVCNLSLKASENWSAQGDWAVMANIVKHYGGNYSGAGLPLSAPLDTITTVDHHALVNTTVVKGIALTDEERYNAWCIARMFEDASEEIGGQVPLERKPYITIHGAVLVDIHMRMLLPRELYSASGFPADFQIERDTEGKKISKTKQVARVGNAVPPVLAERLFSANLPQLCQQPANNSLSMSA